MNIQYRLCEESDRALARQIHHTCYREVVERQFGIWDEELQDKFFTEEWKPGMFQVITVDSKPIGSLCIDSFDDHIKLVEIQILPEYQNQGLGSKIIHQQIGLAKVKRLPMRLQVLKESKAQNLYRRFGFLKTGETETHYLMEVTLDRMI